MEIKVNGKGMICIAMLSAGLAFGDYVSLINSEEVAYISAPPAVAPEEIMTVGSVVFRMDDVNPSTIYGGTWELITGDAEVRFGDGNVQNALVQGNDNKSVPLPKHSHDMFHTHTRGSMEITGYFPTIIVGSFQNGTGGAFWGSSHSQFQNKSAYANSTTNNYGIQFQASRNWSGSTSQPSTTNTGEAGVDNASVNVKGAYITLNVWKRTN
jgi:hypothetical protein